MYPLAITSGHKIHNTRIVLSFAKNRIIRHKNMFSG